MIFDIDNAINRLNDIFPQSRSGMAQISDIRLAIKDVLLAAVEDANIANSKEYFEFIQIESSMSITPIQTVYASYYKGAQINRPLSTRILKTADKEFVLITNMYGAVSVFLNHSFVGTLGNYSSVDAHGSIYGATDISINDAQDKVAISCLHSDTVEVYELIITDQGLMFGNKISRIGVWRSAGNTDTGRIQDPHSLIWLPNDNILVSSYSGYSYDINNTKSKYAGHVSEWDSSTGSIVKTHLGGFTSGKPWDNEIRAPYSIRRYQNDVYISSNDDVIGKWSIVTDITTNATTLEYMTTYTKPANINIGTIRPKGFCVHDGVLWVASATLYSVIGLDLDTHGVVAKFGYWDWDDKAGAKENLNGFNGLTDIEPTGVPGEFYVTDYGNNRVNYSYSSEYTQIQYDIPNNIEIIHADPAIAPDGTYNVIRGTQPDTLKLVYKTIDN